MSKSKANEEYTNKLNLLHTGIEQGDLEKVKEALENFNEDELKAELMQPRDVMGMGRGLLHILAGSEEDISDKIIETILQKFSSKEQKMELLKETDYFGSSVLHYLAMHGKEKVIKDILKNNTSEENIELLSQRNLLSSRPVDIAAGLKDAQTIWCMLEGLDLKDRKELLMGKWIEGENTLLHKAALDKNFSVISTLLKGFSEKDKQELLNQHQHFLYEPEETPTPMMFLQESDEGKKWIQEMEQVHQEALEEKENFLQENYKKATSKEKKEYKKAFKQMQMELGKEIRKDRLARMFGGEVSGKTREELRETQKMLGRVIRSDQMTGVVDKVMKSASNLKKKVFSKKGDKVR
jgi:hypothetical protein